MSTGEVIQISEGRGGGWRNNRKVIHRISLDQIRVYAKQPRQYKEKEKLRGLGASIKEMGQLVPAMVRRLEKPVGKIKYELIGGERRYLACQLLGIKTLDCVIYDKVTPEVQFEIAMIENFYREALTPIEEAEALAEMKKNGNYSNVELAARVGFSEVTVVHRLAILNLDKRVQRLMSPDIPDKKRLPVTAAQIIEPLPKNEQLAVANRIIEGELSLREARDLVRKKSHHGVRRSNAKARRNRDDYRWIHGFLERAEREAVLIDATPIDVLRGAYENRSPRDLLATISHTARLTIKLGKITRKLKQVLEEIR